MTENQQVEIHALTLIDLNLSLEVALTELFSRRGTEIGIPEKNATVFQSNKGADFQCNGALATAKVLKRSPRDLAQAWIDQFSEEERALFSVLEIAGPGFINISVSDVVLAERSNLALNNERLLCPSVASPKRVYIDFGGYNVAKQLHIGHLRSTIIGETLRRVFVFMGEDVVGDVHLGDWGTQMGMLIEAVKEEQAHLPYFDERYEGDYPEQSPITIEDMNRLYPLASTRSKVEPELRAKASEATACLQAGHRGYTALWKHFVKLSIEEIKRDIEPFDVHFDLWYGESHAQPEIAPMVSSLIQNGEAIESEGALIVPLLNAKGEDMVPLMLRKSDGGSTYHTSDLATISMRARESADEILYVVDARQEMHFKQVFQAAHKVGIVSDNVILEHVKFGTINGEDGRPFKTRSGGTVKLREVVEMAIEAAQTRLNEGEMQSETLKDVDERTRAKVAEMVAVAAIKFGDLSNHRASDYILRLEDFCSFEGKTGPYLLYAAVRIKSILAKASERGITPSKIQLRGGADRALALELSKLPSVLETVRAKKTPHILCEYLFNVSQAFSSFYQACNIVREEDEAQRGAWLSLVSLCLKTLDLGLDLLGIKVPERM